MRNATLLAPVLADTLPVDAIPRPPDAILFPPMRAHPDPGSRREEGVVVSSWAHEEASISPLRDTTTPTLSGRHPPPLPLPSSYLTVPWRLLRLSRNPHDPPCPKTYYCQGSSRIEQCGEPCSVLDWLVARQGAKGIILRWNRLVWGAVAQDYKCV